jgi:NTP pyrophosphatase (non-canonical NTP hydrolase)
MLNQFELNKLVESAYKTAVEKGFHDKPLDVDEKVALIIGELGECLEAFRTGKIASMSYMDDLIDRYQINKSALTVESLAELNSKLTPQEGFVAVFKAAVKDTQADELADVCIRLFDLAGALGIEVLTVTSLDLEACRIKGKCVGSDLLKLMKSATKISDANDSWLLRKKRLTDAIAEFYGLCCEFCWVYDIDLDGHIIGKMTFNKTRERLHGNKQF